MAYPTAPAPWSGAPVAQPSPRWALSICATVLGSLPFGVVALIWSAQVGPRWARGDLAGAELAARRATIWSVVAFVVQVVVLLIGAAVLVLLGLSFGADLPDQS